MFDNESGRGRIAQSCASDERIGDVGFDGVLCVEDCGDTTLSPGGCRVLRRFLGDQGDLVVVGETQGKGHSRQSAADDQHVEGKKRWALHDGVGL